MAQASGVLGACPTEGDTGEDPGHAWVSQQAFPGQDYVAGLGTLWNPPDKVSRDREVWVTLT